MNSKIVGLSALAGTVIQLVWNLLLITRSIPYSRPAAVVVATLFYGALIVFFIKQSEHNGSLF